MNKNSIGSNKSLNACITNSKPHLRTKLSIDIKLYYLHHEPPLEVTSLVQVKRS